MNFGSELYGWICKNGVKTGLNNNIDMSQTNTQYLVADYLDYRLQKHGFSWQNCPPLSNRNCKIHHALKSLADNFDGRYHAEFDSMVQQLNISPDIAYPTFLAVANELFIDGKNWGRVVALFVFGGDIAEECVDKQMEHLVDSINEWVSQYIQNHLEHWISSQGGWDGLVEFYDNGAAEKNHESPWPSMGKIFIGAVGVLALGAALIQKS